MAVFTLLFGVVYALLGGADKRDPDGLRQASWFRKWCYAVLRVQGGGDYEGYGLMRKAAEYMMLTAAKNGFPKASDRDHVEMGCSRYGVGHLRPTRRSCL